MEDIIIPPGFLEAFQEWDALDLSLFPVSPEATEDKGFDPLSTFDRTPEKEMLMHVGPAQGIEQHISQYVFPPNVGDEIGGSLSDYPNADIPLSTMIPVTNDGLWKPYHPIDYHCVTSLYSFVSFDVAQRAMRIITHINHQIEGLEWVVDLGSIDDQLVRSFIMAYANCDEQCALNIYSDLYSHFRDMKMIKIGYSEVYIDCDKPELQAQPSVRQNICERRSVGFPLSDEDLRSMWGIKGKTFITGGRKKKQRRQKLGWPDLKTQKKRTVSMTYNELSKYFHLPLEKACDRIRMCTTSVKQICRRLNIGRWPYMERLKAAKKMLNSLPKKYQNQMKKVKPLKFVRDDFKQLENQSSLPANNLIEAE